MELPRQMFNGKSYIDGITIINLEGEILFSAKLNEKLSNPEDSQRLVGRKLLEVYEDLDPDTSSMYKAMELGVPRYVENQLLKARGQEGIRISSLSIPIKSRGRIVGAIDLSAQEFRNGEQEDAEAVSLRPGDFPIGGSRKLDSGDTASFTIDSIIAVDEQMRKARDYIPVVAACDLPVMIYGETGTGKEVFAQAIHNASDRRNKPFITQNCAALPETLLESILFGTTKGAFTGAAENKGLFELADGGTLFLDEINSMPIHLQSKLLRVLQDGSFRSLGARGSKTVNVKIIAAINVEPLEAIQSGQLRQDIYYRLSMMSIHIPPLRERKKDIGHFVNAYVNKHNQTFRKHVRYVSKELMARLEAYDWPGNVRELEQVIVYGMSRVDSGQNTLKWDDVADQFREPTAANRRRPDGGSPGGDGLPAAELPGEGVPLRQALGDYEKRLIRRALETAGGNLSKAARMLGIPRQTLQRRAGRYGLTEGTEP